MPFSLICKGRRQQHSPLVPRLFQFNSQQHLQELQVRQYFLGPNLCLKHLGSGLSLTRFNSQNVYKISDRTWPVELHLPGFASHISCPCHLCLGFLQQGEQDTTYPPWGIQLKTRCEATLSAEVGPSNPLMPRQALQALPPGSTSTGEQDRDSLTGHSNIHLSQSIKPLH